MVEDKNDLYALDRKLAPNRSVKKANYKQIDAGSFQDFLNDCTERQRKMLGNMSERDRQSRYQEWLKEREHAIRSTPKPINKEWEDLKTKIFAYGFMGVLLIWLIIGLGSCTNTKRIKYYTPFGPIIENPNYQKD